MGYEAYPPTQSMRLVHAENDQTNGKEYTYNKDQVSTIAGTINAAHDLMGMIIHEVTDNESITDEYVNNSEENLIYYYPRYYGEGNTKVHNEVIHLGRDENGVPSVYLTLGKNSGPNGVAADNRISYKFNDIEMMDDMNLDTGACTEVKEFGEFDNFIEILRSRMTMTGLGSHAIRYSNAFGNKFSKNRNNGNAPAVGDNMSAPIPDFLSVPNDSMDELPFA